MNIKNFVVGIIAVFSIFILPVVPAFADFVSIDFESPTYGTGGINGQDNWVARGSRGYGCAPYDELVVANTYGIASFGGQSFRISDAYTSPCLFDQAFSRPLVDAVGETSASAGIYSPGTLKRHFEMQFDIASTVPSAQQPGLHMVVSPDRGDGFAMSYLRFEDRADGIHIFFQDASDPTQTIGGDSFNETDIATLDRTQVHTIKLTLNAIDGPSNDLVAIYVDGNLVHTGTSWEDYYRYDQANASDPNPKIIRTVVFSETGDANLADFGKGFLIDNLSLLSQSFIVPTSKDQCKINGWTSYSDTNGTPFKNQGDCVSFVETLGNTGN